MIWKFLKQNVLSPKSLNWVQHLVSRIGLLIDALKLEPNLYKNVWKTSMTSPRPMLKNTVHSSSGFLPWGHFQDGGCAVEFLCRNANNLRQFVNVSSLLETEPHHNHIKWTEAVVVKVRQNFIHQLWTFFGSVVFQESLHSTPVIADTLSVIVRVRNSGSLFQSFFLCVSPGDWLLSASAGCP